MRIGSGIRGLLGFACAVGACISAPVWADPQRVDGEPDEWGEPLAHDVTGDSRGPAGSDILSASVRDSADDLCIMIRVAGGPNLSPSVITYTVDFSLGADFYNRRLVAWADGGELNGAIVYHWESRGSAAEPVAATGARAAAGSVVEFCIPFALLGGRFHETVWMKVSACDHATGIPLDDLQFQYRPSDAPAAGSAGPVPQEPGAGARTPPVGIAVDGSAEDWREGEWFADDSSDGVGPAGTEITAAGICEDGSRVLLAIELQDRPSVAADMVEYRIDLGCGSDSGFVGISGDGRILGNLRCAGLRERRRAPDGGGDPLDEREPGHPEPEVSGPAPSPARAAGIVAAAGSVVEVAIPIDALPEAVGRSGYFRISAVDRKTGRAFDELSFRHVLRGPPPARAGAAEDPDSQRGK